MKRRLSLKTAVAGLAGFALTTRESLAQNTVAPNREKYRTLGKTGLKISPVGFGPNRADIPNVARRAFDTGVNFIDTGRMYENGRNEEMVGQATNGIRDRLIIQTKVPNALKTDPAGIARSIEESLRALRTDYIDIMLLHSVSDEKDLTSPALREAFEKAKKAGKIRFCGFSSHQSNAHSLLRTAVGEGYFDVAMVPYNHAGKFDHTVYKGFSVSWNQTELEAAIKDAVTAGMGIVAMKTCSAGPYAFSPDEKPSFPGGLKWIMKNPDISAMAVAMANFREVESNTALLG